MALNQLSSKKQLFILILVGLLLLGIYVKYRLLSAVDDVGRLNKQLQADEALLKNPNIPEEPLDDIEDLKDNSAALDVELEGLAAQSAHLTKNLPEINSRDVMLQISEAARVSRVRIVSNAPFLVKKRPDLPKLSSKATITDRKRARAARKAAERARRQAIRSGSAQAIGIYTQKGELMDKLVNDFEEPRPLHQLKIEGTYQGIKDFIQALMGMPWQITVVKIDFSLLMQNTAQGYPQPLLVEMIIGA